MPAVDENVGDVRDGGSGEVVHHAALGLRSRRHKDVDVVDAAVGNLRDKLEGAIAGNGQIIATVVGDRRRQRAAQKH